MKRKSSLYIKDILESMEKIEEFIQGMSFEDFTKDDKTSSAVIGKFEIIGEATKNIPQSIKEKIPTFRGKRWQVSAINSYIFTLV